VLIMIEAHTLDSWTRVADRARTDYKWSIVVGGFGAPIFLFLAGVALALAAGSRRDKGGTEAEISARARRRGWEIFGLAFLFRLQSAVLGAGGIRSFLKVDILNIMGLAMVGTVLLWGLARRTSWRIVVLVTAALTTAMVTPLFRETQVLGWLPDPIEAYVRPIPEWSGFTLLPWGGFVLAGAATGLWLDTARTPQREQRAIVWLGVLGAVLVAIGWATSLLPPIYRHTSFWTSSPTFFVLRVGVLIASIPIAYAWTSVAHGRSPVQELGMASLFVYWIHVEMVYGFLTWPIHRRLTFEQSWFAFAILTVILYGLVKLKDRVLDARRRTSR
jgi:uncharacterized membrane protein